MRKINKIVNIALIFMLIGVFMCENLVYAISDSLLRPNLGFGPAQRPDTAHRFNELASSQTDYLHIGLEAAGIYLDLLGEDCEASTIKERLITFLKPAFYASQEEDFQVFLRSIMDIVRNNFTLKEALRINGNRSKEEKTCSIVLKACEVVMLRILKDVNIGKRDLFLNEFRSRHHFINTSEIDFNGKETITVREMLRKYSETHPDKLKDHNSALALVRERDGVMLSGEEMNMDFPEHTVKPGEYYWVIYSYPRFTMEEQVPVPVDIFVQLGRLTPKEQEALGKELEALARSVEWDKKYDWHTAITMWLEKDSNKTLSRLEHAKRLLLYLHKAFDHLPGRDPYDYEAGYRFSSLHNIMREIIKDAEIEAWAANLVKVTYTSNQHKGGKGIGTEYTREFEFLLSLLIGNGRKDIIPIAIHALFESYDYISNHKQYMILDSMITSDNPDIKKAIIIKYLQLRTRYGAGLFFDGSGLFFKGGVESPFDKAGIELAKEFLRYVLYVSPTREEEFERLLHNEYHLLGRLNNLMRGFNEQEILNIFDLLFQEDNPELRRKLFLFLGGHQMMYIALHEKVAHKFMDAVIYLVSEYKMSLKGSGFLYWNLGILPRYLEYKKDEMIEVLLPLLDDPKRDDISDVLSILNLYSCREAQSKIVAHYLKSDSPYFKSAFEYMINMKDREYFDQVWAVIMTLKNEGKITEDNINAVGSYCVAMLRCRGEKALKPEERARIAEFCNKHIIDNAIIDINKDEIPYIHIWITLVGLLGREDKLEQIREIIDKHHAIGIPGLNGEIKIEPAPSLAGILLETLCLFTDEESSKLLEEFSISLLVSEDDKRNQLFKFLGLPIRETNKKRKQELFIKLIDVAVSAQLKDIFSGLINLFVFSDSAFAAETLDSDRWRAVDLSDVYLFEGTVSEGKVYAKSGEAKFIPKAIRNYFMRWFFVYLKHPEKIGNMILLDNKSKFLERGRYKIKTIMREDLGLTEDEISAKFKGGELSNGLLLLFWKGSSEEDEKLDALYLLKPIKDLMDLGIRIEGDAGAMKETIIDKLQEYEPEFYKQVKDEMGFYVDWLIEHQIAQGDSRLIIDRFLLHFLQEKPRKASAPSEYSIRHDRVQSLSRFSRHYMLSVFYPEGLKRESPGDFERTFLRCLGALWVKDAISRTTDAAGYVAPLLSLPIFKEGEKTSPEEAPSIKTTPRKLPPALSTGI